MDESQSKPAAPAPFLTKTYDMVDDPQTNFLVSWSNSGRSFILRDPPEFCKELLPLYFKHNNLSSFVRQLNTYGFRKIDPDQWEFANEDFLRGKKHLLMNIYRRKPIHSHSVQSNPQSDYEKRSYKEEINRLQHENSVLHTELKIHRCENKTGFEANFLRKQLHEMETRQTRMVAFLGELMEKMEFSSALVEESDSVRGKRRRILELDHVDTEENRGSGYSGSLLDLSSVEKLESSLNFWNDFVVGVGERMAAISSKENRSSLEFSPATSSVYNNAEIGVKCSMIDVNSEPCNNNNEVGELREKVHEVAPEMNDVFWEQFLTETPRPSDDSKEVQSERRDTNNVTKNRKSSWNPHYTIGGEEEKSSPPEKKVDLTVAVVAFPSVEKSDTGFR